MTQETEEELSPEEQEKLENQAMEAEFGEDAPDETGADAEQTDTDDESGQEPPESEASAGDGDQPGEGGSEAGEGEGSEGSQEEELTLQGVMEEVNKIRTNFGQELNKLSGSLNGLQGYVKQLSQKASTEAGQQGADAPSSEQVSKAMEDDETYAQLKEEFPEWGQAMDKQMAKLQQDTLNKVKQEAEQQNPGLSEEHINQLVDQRAQEIAKQEVDDRMIRQKHPDWQQTIQSQEFADWFSRQPEETQALASSDDYQDAIKLIDLYVDGGKKESGNRRNQQRLRESVAPTSGNRKAPPSQPLTEDDYMEQEFRRG